MAVRVGLKVSKMGRSESKATLLECMIKNLKKGFGGPLRSSDFRMVKVMGKKE